MKKAFVGILAATAAVIIGTTSAFAAAQGTGYRRNFVDADGDGVCDNYGNAGQGRGRGNGFRGGRNR